MTAATAIEASKPYMVKVDTDIADALAVSGVDIRHADGSPHRERHHIPGGLYGNESMFAD